MKYRVVETSDVTSESLEEILNGHVAQGWRFDGMHFVVKETARRPSMAFLLFTRDEKHEESEPSGPHG